MLLSRLKRRFDWPGSALAPRSPSQKRFRYPSQRAGVAQLAEQLFCKQQVTGSIPVAGSDPLPLGPPALLILCAAALRGCHLSDSSSSGNSPPLQTRLSGQNSNVPNSSGAYSLLSWCATPCAPASGWPATDRSVDVTPMTSVMGSTQWSRKLFRCPKAIDVKETTFGVTTRSRRSAIRGGLSHRLTPNADPYRGAFWCLLVCTSRIQTSNFDRATMCSIPVARLQRAPRTASAASMVWKLTL
jgi:hypothetical protein